MALPPRRPGSARPQSGRSNAGRPRSGRPPASRSKFRPRPNSGDSESAGPQQGERLQKLLAAAGLGSRRACEELILTGRVEVDRQTVTEIGTRVDPLTQEIRVDGEDLPQPRLTYVMVHKIQGVLSTASDPSGRPRVTDMVPPELGRLFPVGRLDMSSEGLILLTNDGELANQLTHPRYGIEKMYHVQVAGQIQQETLDELEKGVYLAEGVAKVVGVSIKSHHKNSTILEMILDEGRNREIRRLLARVGHKVQRLTRVAMGPIKIGDVPPGAYRLLRPDEIAALQECVQDVPVGKRAHKRPGQPRGGSRKLLSQRKPGGSASRSSTKDNRTENRPAGAASGKPSTGRFGSTQVTGGGTRFSRKPTGGKSSNSSPLPKPRTVIGDDEPLATPSESVRSKPAARSAEDRTKKPTGSKFRASKPTTGRASSGKPTGKFRTSKSSEGDASTEKPAYGKASGTKPAYGKSSGTKPSYGKSSGAKTGYGKSDGTKPAYGKASGAKAGGAKPSGGKPSGARSAVKAKTKGKPAFRQGRSSGK
jgi:23S rRNA pseudouridine2605 synthase